MKILQDLKECRPLIYYYKNDYNLQYEVKFKRKILIFLNITKS